MSRIGIIERPYSASFTAVLLSNCVPLIGVMFWGWSFFSVIMIYWFETLWHSFFLALRLITARVNEGHRYFFAFKVGKAIKLILIRTGILLFYLLFIAAFIGWQSTSDEERLWTLSNLFHGQRLLLWGLLAFTVAGIVEYIFQYRLNGEYLTTTPESQFKVIDARFIVIHLVIVLGFFAADVITGWKWTDNAGHVFVSVFVLIKLAVDFVGHLIHIGALKVKLQQTP